ncbi:hypothetical protein [Streptomyces sp. NPDC050982]|uniref:hypothetical protein n=1 Tax=Streptomyces sp. NPDC050982 TaxID=3154746 RepID=UPI0033DFF3E7
MTLIDLKLAIHRVCDLAEDRARDRALLRSLARVIDQVRQARLFPSADDESEDRLGLASDDYLGLAQVRTCISELVVVLNVVDRFFDLDLDLDVDLARGLGRVRDLARDFDLDLVRDLDRVMGRVVDPADQPSRVDFEPSGRPQAETPVQVSLWARGFLGGALLMLPQLERARYAEEWRSDLRQLAERPRGRLQQVSYGFGLLMASHGVRRAVLQGRRVKAEK